MKLIICILGLAAMALGGEDELLQQANDKFTSQMFYEVAKDKTNVGKSVILSAFSVLPPLAQLALASVGPSQDEILRVIGLPNVNVTKSVFQNLNQQLRAVKGVELNMANRIYIAPDAQINQQFALLSNEVFKSDVKNIDFSKQASIDEINAWVEDNTNHKIKNLLGSGSVDSSTRAVLVNAIYFKGLWQNKIDKTKTEDRDFHVSKDNTVKVPTMRVRDDFRYGESDELDAKLLELPYEGGESSLVIVLPNQVDGITTLLEKLRDSSRLNNAIKKMSNKEVEVSLPKFKIETETNLLTVLQKMNINKLFNPTQARLENLLQKASNLYISGAIQKAFIEVNEEGAEAAAANAFIIFGAVPNVLQRSTSFKADRPFYFEIKHRNLPLFNGLVKEPNI